ncbi:MAG: nuclear transport factor 2 family protein [Pseudomonadota bacterium]
MIRHGSRLLLLMFTLALNCHVLAADSIEQRLQVLEDKEAIRTLIFNYGRFVDDRDWDNFANLFASNGGTWNGGMGIAKGREAIHKMMTDTMGGDNANAAGNGLSNVHLLGNEIINVTGDTAAAISKWVFVMTAEAGGPDFVFVGRYEDTFVRENGDWKFQQRIVHGDISKQVNLPGLNQDENP